MGGLTEHEMNDFFTPARRALLFDGWELRVSLGIIKLHESWHKGKKRYMGDMDCPEFICEKEQVKYD